MCTIVYIIIIIIIHNSYMFRPYIYWPSSGSDKSRLRGQRIWLKHVEVVHNSKHKNIVQLVGSKLVYNKRLLPWATLTGQFYVGNNMKLNCHNITELILKLFSQCIMNRYIHLMYQIIARTVYMTLVTSLRNISAWQYRLQGVHKELKTT